MTELAARWLGASVVAASDESFGFKEHLLVTEPPAFVPGHYDHRGEVVDGWETRRRRSGTEDWAIVRLGAPGRIEEVDVETTSFTGNFPTSCRIEALEVDGFPGLDVLLAGEWTELVGDTPLTGDGHNLLTVEDPRRWTHVRLVIVPDGGVARLRVRGTVVPDLRLLDGVTVELSGAEWGGAVVSSSDDFYSSAERLVRPDRPSDMGGGWETARRRHGGCDSIVIALATEGELQRVEVDTAHYKYNASAAVELWGSTDQETWWPLLERTELVPDTRHVWVVASPPTSFVRLDAHPDGGLARVRLWGRPTDAGRDRLERLWSASHPLS